MSYVNNIKIHNIYYMMAYAFKSLDKACFNKVLSEEFENCKELCAEILYIGISEQIKRGLSRDYIPITEELSILKGKIDISSSLNKLSIQKQKLYCTYDEFSENSLLNRIIKSTVFLLLKSEITKERKKKLRTVMIFFENVDLIDLFLVDWNIKFSKNNLTYKFLISTCFLVVKGLIQTKTEGNQKMLDYFDEQMLHHLYEKFILEYFKRHFPKVKSRAEQIDWQTDNGYVNLLPRMQSDIMLSANINGIKKVLIIDAKFYNHNLQSRFEKESVISGNLYQIFTYVKNKETEFSNSNIEHIPVEGMLLYAKTQDQNQPDVQYILSGNKISVTTLDLSGNFECIREKLGEIGKNFLKEMI